MAGFFLGGAAEGMESAEKQRLARETLATERGLRERGLGIQERGVGVQERGATVNERAQTLAEKNAGRAAGQQGLERVDKQIAETMATVAETVKQGLAAGRDPATIQKAVAPLVDSVKRLAPFAKRDPGVFDAQVGALLTGPTPVETATVSGAAAKAKTIAEKGPPVPGVLPGEPTTDDKNALRRMTVAQKTLDKELEDYGTLIKKGGVSFLPGTAERTQVDTSRRNIQLQMKELYNLGVLNGPDLMLMDQMLVDPAVRVEGDRVDQSVFSAASAPIRALYKSATLQGNADANINMLRGQMKRLYDNNRDVIMRVAPAQSSSQPSGGAVDWKAYFGQK